MLALAVAGPPYGAITLALIVPCVLIGAFVVAGRMWVEPEHRPRHAARLLAWAFTLALIACAQGAYAWRARHAADALRAQVEAYRAAHGAWPSSLRKTTAMTRWRVNYFVADSGAPYLCYAATSAPHAIWCYDFDAARWKYSMN